jgi:hypothetical protein
VAAAHAAAEHSEDDRFAPVQLRHQAPQRGAAALWVTRACVCAQCAGTHSASAVSGSAGDATRTTRRTRERRTRSTACARTPARGTRRTSNASERDSMCGSSV